jgi:hypothetical protein
MGQKKFKSSTNLFEVFVEWSHVKEEQVYILITLNLFYPSIVHANLKS